MEKPPELDTVLDVCGHRHRRIVLAELDNQNQAISVNDLANTIRNQTPDTPPAETADEATSQILIDLHHVHLPELARAGFIEFDRQEQLVESTLQRGRNESHLSAILAMDSGRPTRLKTRTSTR